MRLPRDEYRDKVLELLQQITADGHPARGFPKEFGGEGDLGGFIAGFETLAFGDLSLMVKAGVQFGLFAGAILHLGTEQHHERYLADAIGGRLLGCFAMTETGHGSNVQALGTTATYDACDRGVRRPHADRGGAEGLHRQRGAAWADGGRVRAARRRRRDARRALPARPDPVRGR